MKEVYFIRHGETITNVENICRGPNIDDELTELGEKQARLVSKRAKHLTYDTLISSDHKRTQQTAEAVGKETGHQVEISEHFREVKRPSSLEGTKMDSDIFQDFLSEEQKHADDASWHFEDEENFYDLIARADKALSLLESQPEDSMVVVTSGFFLKFLLATMMYGDQLTYTIWIPILKTLKTTNTGITYCRFVSNTWQVTTFNDHAHFAE